MKLVTDPEILKQLNGDNTSSFKPVTDKNILSQLNGNKNNMSIPFNPSFTSKLAPNILAGEAELGHSLLNSPSNIAGALNQIPRKNKSLADMLNIKPSDIPRQQDYDYSSMLGIPGTNSDKAVQGITRNLPSLLMPELGGGALGRVGSQAAFGGLTSNDPLKGAMEYGGAQGAFEGLTLPFKGIKGIAELMNPVEYTRNEMKNIKLGHDNAKLQMNEDYRPVNEKYDDHLMTISPQKYLGFDKTQVKRFTPEVKLNYEEFLKKPNFKNLHDLQSSMGKDYSRIATNPNKIKTAGNLKLSRDYINNKISSFLKNDPEMLAQYNKGRETARDFYYPYLSNDVLKKISKGVKQDISPRQLSNSLTKSREKIVYEKDGKPITAIPDEHPLTKTLNKLNNRIHLGEAAQYAIPTLTGTLTGGHLSPGIGNLLGGGAGGLIAHYLQPHMIKFIQNPAANKIIKSGLGIPTQAISRGIAGYNMQNS